MVLSPSLGAAIVCGQVGANGHREASRGVAAAQAARLPSLNETIARSRFGASGLNSTW